LFTLPEVLTREECADFIARGEGLGFEAASVSAASGPRMMPNVRNNDRAIFDDPSLAEWLWNRVQEYIPQEIQGAVATGLNERFRFYRYDPSQRFNAHRDGAVERSANERSRLTFMIYLNDGFEGGQTVFYSEERVNGLRQVVASVEPVAGMGLCFAHEWWHEGAKVLSGRKYVLRTDVMYRNGE
jgi:predicted 2-oxoglutarate/Fe(II)-dependent dioxygenase YbiX